MSAEAGNRRCEYYQGRSGKQAPAANLGLALDVSNLCGLGNAVWLPGEQIPSLARSTLTTYHEEPNPRRSTLVTRRRVENCQQHLVGCGRDSV